MPFQLAIQSALIKYSEHSGTLPSKNKNGRDGEKKRNGTIQGLRRVEEQYITHTHDRYINERDIDVVSYLISSIQILH
jgi:hypothetical protein